jgi:hypothetical protein
MVELLKAISDLPWYVELPLWLGGFCALVGVGVMVVDLIEHLRSDDEDE